MTRENDLISIEGISKSYPTGFWRKPVCVLHDVSFSVRRNEIVGFLGPNGAGKTTTIKILTRLAFPDSGSVTLLGEKGSLTADLRRRIGFMPEQPYFYEYLTGEEFLHLSGRLCGMSEERIADRISEMLSVVGLEGAGEKPVRKYSKGMMQRLGLAQAILHDPELVILDEPMSGLDPLGRMEIRNLIRDLREGGKTVFFSTHIISDVEALCDRVVMLDRGRKVAEGAVEELTGKETRYVELILSPPPVGTFDGLHGIPIDVGHLRGNLLLLRARDGEEANLWIDAARRGGATVVSVTPVRKMLEEIYVETVSEGRNVAGGEP